MTRKDYVVIAKAIKESSECDNTEELLSVLLTELCRSFKNDNELFNETKFLKACGV